jgi:hypothetical protein
MKNKIIDPFFFEEPMVTGDNFLAMMENTASCHVPVGTVIQLDGAPPHLSHHVCAFLDREFPDCWIRRGGHIPYSSYFPDLTSLDFFFWKFVKDTVMKKCKM